MPKPAIPSGHIRFHDAPIVGDYVGGTYGHSAVMDPNNPEADKRNMPSRSTTTDRPEPYDSRPPTPVRIHPTWVEGPVGSARFDPARGYIVDGEDELVLMENGLNPKQREQLLGRMNAVNDEALMKQRRTEMDKKINGMGPAEADAYIRFDDLAL